MSVVSYWEHKLTEAALNALWGIAETPVGEVLWAIGNTTTMNLHLVHCVALWSVKSYWEHYHNESTLAALCGVQSYWEHYHNESTLGALYGVMEC